MKAPSSRAWQTVLGIAVSVLLLWLSVRKVHFADVLTEIRTARTLPILLGVVLATTMFPVRVVRWRLLLRSEQGNALPSLPLWHAVAMGFMANNVLPFRVGELVRTYAASRLAKVRFTAAFSSIAVERVFDGLTLVLFLSVSLFLAGLPADAAIKGVPLHQVATKAGVVCLVALVAAALVVAFPTWAETVIRRLLPFPRVADRLVKIIEDVRQGLAVLRSPVRLLGVVFWSLVAWLVNGLSFYAFFAAFGIPVDFFGALLMQSLLALGVSVPSTPGYVGVFEGVIVAALALYGIPGDRAFAYAAVYHVTTFLPITLLGLWSLARTNIGLKEMQQAAT